MKAEISWRSILQIQACKMATVSDVVVYGDDKTPRTEVEALAKKISRAQALWQKKNGSDNEERSFNTFVVSGKWQTFKRSSRAANHA
jgi:dual specificity MAP kinase phosphatase